MHSNRFSQFNKRERESKKHSMTPKERLERFLNDEPELPCAQPKLLVPVKPKAPFRNEQAVVDAFGEKLVNEFAKIDGWIQSPMIDLQNHQLTIWFQEIKKTFADLCEAVSLNAALPLNNSDLEKKLTRFEKAIQGPLKKKQALDAEAERLREQYIEQQAKNRSSYLFCAKSSAQKVVSLAYYTLFESPQDDDLVLTGLDAIIDPVEAEIIKLGRLDSIALLGTKLIDEIKKTLAPAQVMALN